MGDRTGRPDGVRAAIEDVGALYTENLASHGFDSRAVGWPTADSQLLRFEKLAYLLDVDQPGGPVTVNDLGCGYGAMFRYLDERGLEMECYRGYDISAEMLRAAREHTGGDPRVELVEAGELTQTADYSFVSGTFNVRMGASEEDWDAFVRSTLRELVAHSRRGFAFNLLSSYVDWKKDDLFYADPQEYFAFCKSELSRFVTLLHDYPLYEWTIVVLTGDRD